MSKKKFVFTDKLLSSLKPTEKKYIRSEGNGFTIVVWPSGIKSWRYRYSFEGKAREMHLGEYPAVSMETARNKFEDARRQVKNDIDPMTVAEEIKLERKRTPILSDFVDDYIRIYAKPKLKSWEKIERSLKRVFVPVLGKKKITDIKRRDIVVILDEVAGRAPVMANRLLAYTRHLFAWAVDRDALEINPLAGMKRPGGSEEPRQRNLSDEEIKTLWKALDAPDLNMTDEIKRAVKLVLVTAQRPGEVIGIHAEEIDGHWWTIPASRAKNGLAHRVYLTQMALSLLGDTTGKGYVFKTAGKEDLPMTELAMNTAIRRHLLWPLKDAKGNPLYNKDGKPATENRLGVDHLTPHDLRRTAASGISNIDFIDEHVDALLNHKKAGIKRVYILNKYDKEKQMMLEAWERKLTSIITGKESKVISINAGKKAA